MRHNLEGCASHDPSRGATHKLIKLDYQDANGSSLSPEAKAANMKKVLRSSLTVTNLQCYVNPRRNNLSGEEHRRGTRTQLSYPKSPEMLEVIARSSVTLVIGPVRA